MKNLKRLFALGLVALTSVSTLVGCGKAAGAAGSDAFREIKIGSWWRQYYDSSDENMDVSTDWTGAQDKEGDDEAKLAENAVNRKIAQAKWDNVAKLEEKYNCKFYWTNLTFAGTTESLNTSVLAGSPDCDIYMVQASQAIPAQANGLLVDLKTILPADADLFTTQKVFSYVDMGDGKACILQVNGGMANTYPLAFNKQMLEKNNLEDPRDLYERGEWTWDKLLEYCEKLTQDTDGDGQIDQYGFCGFANDTLAQLLFSNSASIASGATTTITDDSTGEALDMFQKLFSPKCAYPYDYYYNGGNASDSMRIQYNEGNIAFFPIAVWIQDANGNYPMDNGGNGNITFDTVYVQWPIGPSGSKETNPAVNAIDSQFFVIPAGVKDPLKVYNFLYDLYNWFDGDTTLRDDPATATWWYNSTGNKDDIKASNFEVQKYCLSKPGIEMFDQLGVEFSLEELIDGTQTPAQWQETYKQAFQDALDRTYGK